MLDIDYKVLCALGASLIGIYSYAPYIVSILKGIAKPHVYTWGIWTVTQSIAAAGVWSGHGGWTAIGLAVGCILLALITVLAAIYGTRDITLFDTLLLVMAFFGVALYFATSNPLYSVLVASFVDMIGYIPTLRKTWHAPATEPPVMWLLWVLSTALALLGLQSYNLLTVPWLAVACGMNSITLIVIVYRGKWFSH